MNTAASGFVVLGPQHQLVLLVFAAGCIALLLLGARLRRRPALQGRVMRAAGALILVACSPFEAYDVYVGVQHPRSGLPVQICDFAWLVAGVAFLTRGRRSLALLYFWGLTLSLQGVLTPEMSHEFPQWQFFGFFVRHITPVWAAVYLLGARLGPTWRDYRFAVVVTGVWVALVMGLNAAIGSNYGYLNGKPRTRSLLDLLGPWPWYVLLEIVVVAGGWALMTWPWNRSR